MFPRFSKRGREDAGRGKVNASQGAKGASRIQTQCRWHFVPASGQATDGLPGLQAKQGLQSAAGTLTVLSGTLAAFNAAHAGRFASAAVKR